MTREKYSAFSAKPTSWLSVSRDTLNPLLNHEKLKTRLNVIQHYKYINGVEMAHWPHFAMSRFARHVYRFKFNYAIKGFAAYVIYRDVAEYRKMKETSFVTI